jgi:hypothetical protein
VHGAAFSRVGAVPVSGAARGCAGGRRESAAVGCFFIEIIVVEIVIIITVTIVTAAFTVVFPSRGQL